MPSNAIRHIINSARSLVHPGKYPVQSLSQRLQNKSLLTPSKPLLHPLPINTHHDIIQHRHRMRLMKDNLTPASPLRRLTRLESIRSTTSAVSRDNPTSSSPIELMKASQSMLLDRSSRLSVGNMTLNTAKAFLLTAA